MRTQTTSYVARQFAGDLSALGGPATDEAVAGYIRAEQMSLVLGYSVGIMLANACNAADARHRAVQSPDWTFALGWAVIVAGAADRVRPAIPRRAVSPAAIRPAPGHAPPVRKRFHPRRSLGHRPGRLLCECCNRRPAGHHCLCSGHACRRRAAFATIPIAAIAFTTPIFIGIAICLSRDGDPAYVLMAILVVVYGSVLLRAVFVNSSYSRGA